MVAKNQGRARPAWGAYMARLVAFMALAAPGVAGAEAPRLQTLDSLLLPFESAGGTRIDELSGLAWDEDEQLLYAVSDRGVLHHLRLRLADRRIAELEPVFSISLQTTLQDGSGRGLRNAEGLATINGENGVTGDTELLIAFEDGPMIGRFTPLGRQIAEVTLPEPLADASRYSEENSRLESVAFDPRHGVLTAPEEALLGEHPEIHTIYASDGWRWSFKTFQPHRSNLKAIETMADGSLLILERTRVEKGGASIGRLRHLDLVRCAERPVCEVADLVAASGGVMDDNFEGMARIGGDLYLAVTDRKEKDLEPTRLVLFSVVTPNAP